MSASSKRCLALFVVLLAPLQAAAQADPGLAALRTYRSVWLTAPLEPVEGSSILPPCDDCTAPVMLPFEFQFFGTPYSAAVVSSNGAISFKGAAPGYMNSIGLLQSMVAVAPLWDDWDLHCRGQVLYDPLPDRAVFTWAGVSHYPCSTTSPNVATFQAVLFQDGRIELHSGSTTDGLTATIGISTADVVSTIAWDVTSTTSGTTVRFLPGPNQAPLVSLAPLPAVTNATPLAIAATVTDPNGDAVTARVYVDGTLVATPTVLPDGAVSASVPLVGEGAHTIRVDGIDDFGAVTHASQTTVYDATAPTLDVDPTPDLAGTATLTLTGSATDANGVSVSVSLNGVARDAPLSGAAFSVVLALADGPNTISVTARDPAGNETLPVTRTVIVDAAPPTVTFAAPLDVVPSIPFAVVFSVTDETRTSAIVSVGGFTTTVQVPNDGSASTVLADTGEGPATIVVTVTDEAGHATTVSRPVLVDLSAPLLQLETSFPQRPLEDGMIFGAASRDGVAFNLVVDDVSATRTTLPVGAAASLDGTGGEALLPAGGGVISGVLPLVEGTNTFTFVTTDDLHPATTLSRTVLYDATPPEVTVLAPKPSAAVRGVLEWSATADDALTGVVAAAVRLDGGAWNDPTLASDGRTWTAPFDTRGLAEGAHAIESSFSDRAGNARSSTVTFTVDNTPPMVGLSPLGEWIRGTVQLEATASDATSGVASLELSVDGQPRATCTDASAFPCTYAMETTAFLDGPVTVSATATDAAGNVADAQAFATIDNSAPANFLVSPAAGSVVTGSVTVAVNVVDPTFASVQCTVGGTALLPSTDPRFTETVSLLDRVDGPLTVACTVRDVAGNEGTQAATVMVRNWTAAFEPNTLNLRSRGTTVSLGVEGSTVGLLVPVAAAHVALSVAGGAPVPALDHPASASTADADGDGVPELQLKFDRGALIDALRAGIATGAIDPSAPVRVTLLVNGQPSAWDTVRIVR